MTTIKPRNITPARCTAVDILTWDFIPRSMYHVALLSVLVYYAPKVVELLAIGAGQSCAQSPGRGPEMPA